MSTTMPTTWLTADAHDKLALELDSLQRSRTRTAGASESAEVESRINHLVALLRSAQVRSPEDDGVVEPGMVVEARIDGAPQRFLLGSREIDGGDLDVYSHESPLGAAIHGTVPGDTVRYRAPSGIDVTVEILSARPWNPVPSAD